MPFYSFFTRLIALWLLTVSSAGATDIVSSASARIELIRADWLTLEQAGLEYQSLRKRGQLGEVEADDYRTWLARLRERLARDCAELERLAADPLPADLPCRSLRGEDPVPVSIDMQVERTRGESTAALDGELDASLGQFDDKLLREQERIKAATPRSDSAGSGESGPGGDVGGSPGRAGDTVGSTDAAAAQQQAGQAEADAPVSAQDRVDGGTRGKPGGAVASTAPDGIPDGSDDDVVARQLREAAEKETDPELRRKLWEEYRKYKQGIE